MVNPYVRYYESNFCFLTAFYEEKKFSRVALA
jgi:hypothetical protein